LFAEATSKATPTVRGKSDGEITVPRDPREAASTRKGCLTLYGIWAVFTALVVGFLLLTSKGAGNAVFFGVILMLLPGVWYLSQQREIRRISAAALRLGFRHRNISWKDDGPRLEPRFEQEAVGSDWNYDVLEGWRDETDVAVYDAAYLVYSENRRGSPVKALGVIWSLRGAVFPKLVVHGSDTHKVLVPAREGSGREAVALSTSPPLGPASPIPGFQERFSCFGENGAELLLTEAVQRVLLDLGPQSRLVVEGSRLRWETDFGPSTRGLGRSAEGLLERTSPLRDALREALSMLPRRTFRDRPTDG
jgi:hypothetical protein